MTDRPRLGVSIIACNEAQLLPRCLESVAFADEVVVMQQGKVIEAGPKEEMFTPPHHPYTDLLLSSVPEMDPDWLTRVVEERGVDNIGEAAMAEAGD